MITSKKQLRSVEFFDESGNGYIVLDDEVFYEYTGWNKIYEDEYDGNEHIIDEHGSIVSFEEIDGKGKKITYSKYFLDNKNDGNFIQLTHRLFGPAAIIIYENENFSEEWRVCGKRHREDGPAEIRKNGVLWCYNNVIFDYGENGFWALWNRLDEKGRQNHNLLKYLVMFS
jgi:hypothetical protein